MREHFKWPLLIPISSYGIIICMFVYFGLTTFPGLGGILATLSSPDLGEEVNMELLNQIAVGILAANFICALWLALREREDSLLADAVLSVHLMAPACYALSLCMLFGSFVNSIITALFLMKESVLAVGAWGSLGCAVIWKSGLYYRIALVVRTKRLGKLSWFWTGLYLVLAFIPIVDMAAVFYMLHNYYQRGTVALILIGLQIVLVIQLVAALLLV